MDFGSNLSTPLAGLPQFVGLSPATLSIHADTYNAMDAAVQTIE